MLYSRPIRTEMEAAVLLRQQAESEYDEITRRNDMRATSSNPEAAQDVAGDDVSDDDSDHPMDLDVDAEGGPFVPISAAEIGAVGGS